MINLDRMVFNEAFHEFFGEQTRLWSIVIVGRFRYLARCSTEIYNRKDIERENAELTFTVETNLQVQVSLDGSLLLDTPWSLSNKQT